MYKNLKKSALYIFLSFCLVASAIVVIPNGNIYYMIGLAIIFLTSLRFNQRNNRERDLYIMFLLACFLSSIINDVYNYRMFVFALTLIACTPITMSERIVRFRTRYLFFSLLVFPIISVISLYCYFVGFNCFSPEEGDVTWDFSAIFPHPMWLAAAVGLANTVILWLVLLSKKVVFRYLFILILLLSLFLSVVAASRSALAASLISMSLLLLIRSTNIKKLLVNITVTSALLFILFPIYYEHSGRIQSKMEYSADYKYGSRQEHFYYGFEHLKDNPIVGAGFATAYYENRKVVGRLESGSGWLSILFQTGIVGSCVMIFLLYRLRRLRKFIKSNNRLQLFLACFVFLCFHSCFEGYILTSGYYLCILFWVMLGLLDVYPKYSRIIEADSILYEQEFH